LNKYSELAKQIKKVKIKSFKASDDVMACMHFFEGYGKVLNKISHPSTNYQEWFGSKDVYGVLVEYNSEIIGGLLLFCPESTKTCFPFEKLIQGTFSNHQLKTKNLIPPCAEIFAVWTAELASGWGLSYLLIKAGLCLSHHLKIEKTYYLIAEYNIRMAERLGMEPLKQNGSGLYNIIKTSFSETKVYMYLFDTNPQNGNPSTIEPILEITKNSPFITTENVLGSNFEIEYTISL
jgi:hypothetical protein